MNKGVIISVVNGTSYSMILPSGKNKEESLSNWFMSSVSEVMRNKQGAVHVTSDTQELMLNGYSITSVYMYDVESESPPAPTYFLHGDIHISFESNGTIFE